MTGVIRLFYSFRDHLRKERSNIAPLQLAGRIEDFLVHQFLVHTFHSSGGRRFALPNFGNSGERKYDIAIVSVQTLQQPTIQALLEAKYLRNRHLRGIGDARDETLTTLRNLHQQLATFDDRKHGGLPVKLAGRRKDVYGLVFGSHVEDGKRNDKETFFDDCLQKANDIGFRYHDLKRPYWRSAFEDEQVRVLGDTYQLSLRVGLWRLSTSKR